MSEVVNRATTPAEIIMDKSAEIERLLERNQIDAQVRKLRAAAMRVLQSNPHNQQQIELAMDDLRAALNEETK